MEEEFVVVCELNNEVEALSLQEYLREAGIESVVRNFAVPPYDADFIGTGIPGIGAIMSGKWGELLVPSSRKEEALKIIEEIKKAVEEEG
jgi:GGDEF domain-containing protein